MAKTRTPCPVLDKYLKRQSLSRAAFAKKLKVSAGLVSHWITGEVVIPAERAIQIETETRGALTRRELRPDLFSRPAA